MIAAAVVLATFAAFAAAYSGVDLSEPTSSSSFGCLVSNGYNFAIIRAYQSNEQPDYNAPGSIAAAWAGGMSYVDVYMFPCATCGNPQGQVSSMLANLANNGLNHGSGPGTYGTVWLDIEAPGYWNSDQGANADFFSGLVQQLQAQGQVVGVYTSASQWIPIMGGWTGGSSFPLWYAHYDNNPSFSDFSPFNGWGTPSIKQYDGTTGLCGAGVDLDWYP